MANNNSSPQRLSQGGSLALLIVLNIGFYALTMFPIAALLLIPLNTLVTTLHELGHALACLATGGSVSAMTIVSDGHGHGGLTWTMGGYGPIVDSMGYLGAAFFGCLFIYLGRKQEYAKNVLKALGVLIGLAGLFLVGRGLIQPPPNTDTMQVVKSLGACLGMSIVLVFLGAKLNAKWAQGLLLILAGQTALNALMDTFGLIMISLHMVPYNGDFTDATNMAAATHLPAALWSIVWGLISLIMLVVTLKLSYGGKQTKTTA